MDIDPTLLDALRAADQLIVRHGRERVQENKDRCAKAYRELVDALDSCSALPGSEHIAPGIAQRRIVATTIYNRSDEEAERALQEVLRVEPELMRRATSVIAACRDRPALMAKYLPVLIKELEGAVAEDFFLWRTLTLAYQARAELEAPGSTTAASGPPDRHLRTWPW
jgi:hypothetical protein